MSVPLITAQVLPARTQLCLIDKRRIFEVIALVFACMDAKPDSLSEHIKEIGASNPEMAFSAGDITSLEEGLDLLAAYRAIPDRRTRLLLKRLVETVARSGGELGPYIVCDAP